MEATTDIRDVRLITQVFPLDIKVHDLDTPVLVLVVDISLGQLAMLLNLLEQSFELFNLISD